MTTDVELVVEGGVGDLVASMLGDLAVERCPVTTRFVVDEDELPVILTRLAEAEVDVLSIIALPTPDG